MSDVTDTERRPHPIAVFRHELDAMGDQFRAALPAHIPAERFARVVATAVQNNPELLECNRTSLWNAAMRAAQDGLLPDGREGAMVVRRDYSKGKVANWQPMIAGIRKKARNSGEIATWDAHIVRQGDHFQFQLGDNPQVNHTYDLSTERGPIIGAYSVCTLKDGQKSYEVMTIGEIHAIRDRSDAWKAFKAGKIKSTPWASDEGEMCRKTVARRHAKVLPMSTDLDDLIRRDDDLYDFKGAREEATSERPKSLASRLDALAAPPQTIDGQAAADDDDAGGDDAGGREPGPTTDDTTAGGADDASDAKPYAEWNEADCRAYGRSAYQRKMTEKAAVPPDLRTDFARKELILEGYRAARAEESEAA